MKILSFAATNSSKSINKQLIEYVIGKTENVDIDYIDLNDFELPIYSEDIEERAGVPDVALAFQKRIHESDGILVSLAEHNGNYTAVFKNLFDWLSRIDRNVYNDKPVLLLSTSPGEGGASTVLSQAVNATPYFGGQVVGSLSIPSFYENFDTDNQRLSNELLDSKLDILLKRFIHSLQNS